MSRVIKFRALVNREMKFDVGVHPHISELHDDGSMTISTSLDLFPVMQFTGLLDKNGKEIYEGDILKDDAIVAVVEWDTTNGRWYSTKSTVRGWRDCAVIGNLDENPELLKS